VDEIAAPLAYDAYGGFALAAILAVVLVGMRGVGAWSRWTALLLLPLFMLGQVLFITSDPTVGAAREGLLPPWYPGAQHAIELPLFLDTLAAVILLAHESSGSYFDEGLIDLDTRDEMGEVFDIVRRKRGSSD
jgi:hypothetical protein